MLGTGYTWKMISFTLRAVPRIFVLRAKRSALSIIDRAGGTMSKKDLIEPLQEAGMIPRYQPSQPRSAPHSRLRAILDTLEIQWHFVQVHSRGRKSEVSLTEQGNNALRIFGAGGKRARNEKCGASRQLILGNQFLCYSPWQVMPALPAMVFGGEML